MPQRNTDDIPLPDDPAALKALVRELLQSHREQRQQLDGLQARLDLLLRRLYGPRAERIDPNQQLLFMDVAAAPTPVAQPDPTSTPEPARKRRGHGRQRLPDHLPRERVVHELPEAERLCPCCQRPRQAISTETSEQLDYRPASLFILEHVRQTYVCTTCQGTDTSAPSTFVTAPKPADPIARGLPGPGLLAHVIVCKYSDHLPLHRLEGIFARQGVRLSRTTLCDWMAECATLLRPLTQRMAALICQGRVIHVDDTPVPVRQPGRNTTASGSLWDYLGDHSAPYVVYDFTLGRVQSGPVKFLRDFTGYLQADAYSGYDVLYQDGRILEVACWAHARRKFYEARQSDSERSHRVLGWIRQLYDVERQIREESQEQGLDRAGQWTLGRQRRQERSLPLLSGMRPWLEEQRANVLPKSPLGEAIGYALNHWEALVRYTSEGFLSIDNNAAEQSLRAIAVGRGNWLFCGSVAGGHTAAVLYSLTQSCRRLGLDPWAYLREVLTKVPRDPGDLDRWLPDRWAARGRVESTDPSAVPTN